MFISLTSNTKSNRIFIWLYLNVILIFNILTRLRALVVFNKTFNYTEPIIYNLYKVYGNKTKAKARRKSFYTLINLYPFKLMILFKPNLYFFYFVT